jgi:uncharacterized protein (TIGR02284 family)
MHGQQTNPDTDAAADALTTLHRRTVDALTGYATMVEKAEPSFQHVAEAFRSLHARHADRLARMLADIGREADDDGSLMGTVNAAVVTLRAFFDEIDADVMHNIRDGEKHVLAAFDEAIAAPATPAIAADLKDMRGEVTALLQSQAAGS